MGIRTELVYGVKGYLCPAPAQSLQRIPECPRALGVWETCHHNELTSSASPKHLLTQDRYETVLAGEAFLLIGGRRCNAESAQIAAQNSLRLGRCDERAGTIGRRCNELPEESHAIALVLLPLPEKSWIEGSSVLEDQLFELQDPQPASIGIGSVNFLCQGSAYPVPLTTAGLRRDSHELSRRIGEKPHTLTPLEPGSNQRSDVVQREVLGTMAGAPQRQFAGCVEQDPGVRIDPFLSLHDQELSSARRRFPSDATKRIPRSMLAKFAKIEGVARAKRPSRLRPAQLTTPTRRLRSLAARRDQNDERIREDERRREKSGWTCCLDGKAEDAHRSHALGFEPNAHPNAGAPRNHSRPGQYFRSESRGMDQLEARELERSVIAVRKRRAEIESTQTGRRDESAPFLPAHLEAAHPRSQCTPFREGASRRHAQNQRPTEKNAHLLPPDDARQHRARAEEAQVKGAPQRNKLHAEPIRAKEGRKSNRTHDNSAGFPLGLRGRVVNRLRVHFRPRGPDRLRRIILAGLLATFFAWPAPAHERSALEKSLIAEALADLGLDEDPAPTGKIIESVETYSFEVFDERDPVPDWINWLHGTSRSAVIERELLQGSGERYDALKIEESERNLRTLRQLSLANVVAARGSDADRVRLVIVAKDVWSLRLNSDFKAGSNGLELLLLNPSEENIAGTHTSVGLIYQYERYRDTFGGRFVYPRIGGSRLRTSIETRVMQGRETGLIEGSSGSFVYALPLFSRFSKWGFSTSIEWLGETTRYLQKNELASVPIEVDGISETVPWMYQTDSLFGQIAGVRSFGVNRKYDLRFGIEADRDRYRADSLPEGSAIRAAYESSRYVPVSNMELRPFVRLSAFEARFHRVVALESLGLQEDVRIGYSIDLATWFGSAAAGSTRDLWGVSASLGYALPWRTGLLSARVSNSVTLGSEARNDALISGGFRIATPWLGFGRFHVDFDVASRYENYRRVGPFLLGGNNRLRGYPSSYFAGRDQLVANFEFRSTSIDILSAQTGLALFYDVGDTSPSLAEWSAHHSVGLGVRVLFPQANREVLRADWGFPLGDPTIPAWPGAFFITFGQAFALP